MTAATTALCFGPGCRPFPTQVGQFVVISSYLDVQPIYQLSSYTVDEAHVEEATRKLDALAALGAERDR